jgi:tetraacyldisaccharide 4'-kinase
MVVGGSGKTPVVAALAELLTTAGHRPAILSRGYRRRSTGVIVVSDGTGPGVGVDESGDEPQMLARDLVGVPVIVAADRSHAGRVAIERFDSTVLILDDGFQHLQLERTVDLLVLSSADLREKVLPSGRLREPLSAARMADAVLAYGSASEAQQLGATVGVARAYGVSTRYLPLRSLSGSGTLPPSTRIAVAVGIARPERVFDALRQLGHDIAHERVFPDHHWFTAADVRAVEGAARAAGAAGVVTTAKDAVRLERHRDVMTLPWAILPMSVSIEPAVEFESWLRQRL